MRRSYKTPWKKSRTYGDIYGGRARRRMTDNIFYRAHSLQRPSDDEILPIVFQDNPSRDYFFPATAEEVLTAFEKLPDSHRDGITHIWLRRSGKNKINCDEPLAEFICGSGVRVIVLYAWPTDGVLFLGKRKPQAREISYFLRFGGLLQKHRVVGPFFLRLTHYVVFI